MKKMKILIISTLALLAVNACAAGAKPIQGTPLPTLESKTAPTIPAKTVAGTIETDDTLVAIYEAVNEGVASIIVYADGVAIGQGSGFVIDEEGHIITNYHVVEGATDIEVAFSNGMRFTGEVIGTDLDSDLAVIRVEMAGSEISPLALGDSIDVRVGESVIAIGNPYGLSGTMTVGIISARGRLLDSMRAAPSGGFFTSADLIQTDAAINPGNSGGPLLNYSGEVIGINRAIRTENGESGLLSNSGIGFAVPIDIVKRVVPYLIKDGRYDYPYLGIVSREDLTLAERESLGFLPDVVGAYIIEISNGGPAQAAGLRGGSSETDIAGLPAGGDLITAVDDQPVRSFSDLLAYLLTYKSPGDSLDVTVLRDGQEITIPVELDQRPE